MQITSVMMVNPLNQKHLDKVPFLDTGIAIINLEDGIAKEMKEKALENVCEFLKNLKEKKSKIVIRVNSIDNGAIKEIKKIIPFAPDAIRVSKIKTKQDVQKILEIIPKHIEIHLSIETKEAFNNIRKLKITSQITTLYLGILDLLNSLNISHDIFELGNPLIDYILSKFLIDSKTYGFFPIGFVFQDYNDIKTFKNWCLHLKKMGYSAIGSLGPKQSQIAKEIFGSQNKEKAQYIINKFEEMKKQGITGFMDEKYGFIDEPIYKNALLKVGESEK